MPEQAFLAKNYDENAKKPDRDPRGAFRNPTNLGAAAGIVGPLGSSSFNLPNVERALSEMEGSGVVGGAGAGVGGVGVISGVDPTRKVSGRPTGRPPPTMLSAVATSPPLGRPPTSPTTLPTSSSSPGPTPTSGQTQHEVLQNFFQSLLTSKDRVAPGAAAAASSVKRTVSNSKTNGSGSGGEEGA